MDDPTKHTCDSRWENGFGNAVDFHPNDLEDYGPEEEGLLTLYLLISCVFLGAKMKIVIAVAIATYIIIRMLKDVPC